jgi:transcriptional regulator with XRE-family HTH domain
MTGGKNQNSLWRARKRRGLKQKQVAHLLGQKTIDQVSRYEIGTRLPVLRTALALEIILGQPSKVLFRDLYTTVRDDITKRLDLNAALRAALPTIDSVDHCSVTESLVSKNVSDADLDKAREHSIYLVNVLSERLQQARNHKLVV